jgi:hypothetical protein
MLKKEFVVSGRKLLPSLVDLCIKTAIDNVRYLGDVGETDINLLDRILPHCTVDQLMHIEKSSEVRRPVLSLKLNVFIYLFYIYLSRTFEVHILINSVGKGS